ncbi:MAG: (2Fe-2S)-binding protein [Candidatus Competibacteraceae bacterium]|nr:(2Fe-2S)-binding protein [Candidatus Competibacteraceae bacterium]
MISLTINNQYHEVNVAPDTPLLWVLRDTLGLTGTKYGCGQALCGACTVHVNGSPVRSCSIPVSALAGSEVTTIEGATGQTFEALKQSWVVLNVPQCGYCQSGQLMGALALLNNTPKPSDADIDAAMSGNLCRCATYLRIRAAIHGAADLLEASS